jgi:hypothetical protein
LFLSPLEVSLSQDTASNKILFSADVCAMVPGCPPFFVFFLLSGSRMRKMEIKAEFSLIGKNSCIVGAKSLARQFEANQVGHGMCGHVGTATM